MGGNSSQPDRSLDSMPVATAVSVPSSAALRIEHGSGTGECETPKMHLSKLQLQSTAGKLPKMAARD
eukprot:CAMPEP_0178401522 /NCGR_PEP_ID=MMETSP0689_2-20121128/16347_1 /TAXON_ID=160604 /ORGANISM="Amphidinium massartii, Strain CS-259" /LENGTH=66 /DNA_ID=CAMNT_0020022349 /DNA_START=54 /DNA_END=254 /DNA_ORIENTATION=-